MGLHRKFRISKCVSLKLNRLVDKLRAGQQVRVVYRARKVGGGEQPRRNSKILVLTGLSKCRVSHSNKRKLRSNVGNLARRLGSPYRRAHKLQPKRLPKLRRGPKQDP